MDGSSPFPVPASQFVFTFDSRVRALDAVSLHPAAPIVSHEPEREQGSKNKEA
jgi:hypothetical protein